MNIKLDASSAADKEYIKLRKTLENNLEPDEIEEIDKAFDWARQSHEGQLRFSGQPYIIHPIAVAQILADYGMDKGCIIAALLHDIVEDTDATIDDVRERFGDEIASIVDGLTKMGKVPLSTKEEQQAENVRKMLLAMSQDIRVIIIKLADRIHNLRTLSFMRPQKRRDKAQETLEIYAPIAHRLGIRAMKEELEDLAISYLDPIAYNDIEVALAKQQKTRSEYLEQIKQQISDRVRQVVPDCHIEGRIKSVHGIYRKMYMQNKSFDEIYDVYAVRIIVNEVIDCYNCLGVIHDMFTPIPGRFKDYISTPKPNMYQSLHTTVIGREGIPFEVQIRTWEMHRTAEYGIAAHWKYKLGISGQEKLDERLTWIRKLLEEQNETESPEDIVRTIKTDFVPEEVFVFTPKGDVVSLPSGSTVIDFAYGIHSAVGHKMMGAKVDGRIVPLDYQVKTGEIVEILTSSQPGKGPSRDWLNIARTSSARAKIRAWFKKEKRDENIVEGKLTVEREFRRNAIRLDDAQREEFILSLAQKQRMNTADDFYAAVGYGGISISKMMPHIKDDYSKLVKSQKSDDEIVKTVPVKTKRTKSDGVVIEGIDNCLVKFSKCCNPLPGDEIIGFITRGHGVSIHKRDCTNVPKQTELSPEPERWIKAYWDNQVKEDFKANLTIVGMDRIGLLMDITAQFAAMHVDIHSVNSKTNKDGRAVFNFVITVNGAEHLKSVMAKMAKVNGVLDVERSKV
ncbi:MAG: RelA/SpoT family protein [Acutalibacteraceae bacterium]